MSSNERKYENVINRFWLFWFWRRFFYLLSKTKPLEKILEVGCGEGFVLQRIKKVYPQTNLYGLDISVPAINRVKDNCPFVNAQVGNIYQLPFADNEFPLVLALEVLEHLDKPKRALEEIKRVTSAYVILSVPWEPWFSLGSLLRGNYLQTWGRHPEHINFWNQKEFTKLIGQYFEIQVAARSFPWLIILAKKK